MGVRPGVPEDSSRACPALPTGGVIVNGVGFQHIRDYAAAFEFDGVVESRHALLLHEIHETLMASRAIKHEKTSASGTGHFAAKHAVLLAQLVVQAIHLRYRDLVGQSPLGDPMFVHELAETIEIGGADGIGNAVTNLTDAQKIV